MVFIEAQVSGLPIISYATGAIPEIVGRAGIVLKEGDIAGIAKSFKRLHSERHLVSKLGTIGTERAQNMYDCKRAREKINELYQTLDSGL
jgi:glycosyltransferase involved in cell wall biosynthesis